MKIGFDLSPLDKLHAKRGIGFYSNSLFNALKKLYPEEVFDLRENIKFDIIHYPYFDISKNSLSVSKNIKTIVTIHDLIPIIYKKQYPLGIKGTINFFLQKLALRKVDAIIAVSNTTKKDIVRILNIDPKKIFVVNEGPGNSHPASNKSIDILKKYNLPKEYILYIGDVNYNKNLVRLCEAVIKIKKHLVIVGKQAVEANYDKQHVENKDLNTLNQKYFSNKLIRRLGFLENDDFASVLASASLYCQPSLYEGFGLPVLEAMNAKIPVACSKTQSLVELTDNSALYFNPYNVNDIANKLLLLLKNKKLSNMLAEKAYLISKKYTWENAALKVYKVYKNIQKNSVKKN